MKSKTYSIFGAGAAGLYTAWRLLGGGSAAQNKGSQQLEKGDTLELYEWGQYDFSSENPGSRAPGARVCTWHYKNDPTMSYLEVGGMRYSDWNGDNGGDAGGHRLVTTVIEKLGLKKYSVPFNESTNPLFYLRTRNMYLNGINSDNPAPYAVDHYGASDSPDNGFNIVESIAVTQNSGPQTRNQWCEFYQNGVINTDLPESCVFQKGDLLTNIGYWNLMFDQLGSEGYNYTNDGNGYTSNVINWNSAVAFNSNNEFTPGTEYKTLTKGYSYMFKALFDAIVQLAHDKGVNFEYHPNTRLHSILHVDGQVRYTIATREHPNKKSATRTTDAAWLAMPRHSIELVAQATRYEDNAGLDVLNDSNVQLYLESAVLQPSYKVGIFFDQEWWLGAVPYPAPLISFEVTEPVLGALEKEGFPKDYISKMRASSAILENPYASGASLVDAVQQCVSERLTYQQEQSLLQISERNTIGPSITDMPIRQVVYFGNNAEDKQAQPVYGLLASYDDEQFTDFWTELEIDGDEKKPVSENLQPLVGPRKVPDKMLKMLLKQLAAVHFGPNSDASYITSMANVLEAKYMDWSKPPFNAGYHAYAGHFNVCDVQQKIRKPSQLIQDADANIFIVGETYSNDQAWVEGAYCTAESVLNDFFGIAPIIDPTNYPFICPVCEVK